MHSIGNTTDEIKTQIQIKREKKKKKGGNVYNIQSAYRMEFGRREGSEREGGRVGSSSQNSRGVEAAGHEEDRRTSAPQVGVFHECPQTDSTAIYKHFFF